MPASSTKSTSPERSKRPDGRPDVFGFLGVLVLFFCFGFLVFWLVFFGVFFGCGLWLFGFCLVFWCFFCLSWGLFSDLLFLEMRNKKILHITKPKNSPGFGKIVKVVSTFWFWEIVGGLGVLECEPFKLKRTGRRSGLKSSF